MDYNKGLIYSLGVCCIAAGCNKKQSIDKQKQGAQYKNIVVIVSDDHTTTTLGCYGNKQINTPNLDKMAKKGVTFSNAYCNAPICSASRQSLLTSKYPHATGVTLLFTPFNDTLNHTIGEHLQQKGYRTGLIGKTHFNNWIWWGLYNDGKGFPDHGFHNLITKQQYKDYLKKHPPKKVADTIMTYDDQSDLNRTAARMNARVLPVNKHIDDAEGTFFTNKAIDFIKENKDTSFFLWLAYHEPHSPFRFPVEYRNKYKPADMTLPKGSPEDDRWVPEIFRSLSDKEKKGIIAAYYSCVEYMDYNIGRVLNAINELGLDENTLVIYISDHGYLLYDHKRFEKHTMWEESVKSPLIIQGGEDIGKPRKEHALVEYIDIIPTICDAVGTEQSDQFQGTSFMPVLTNKAEEHKQYVFAEFLEDNKAMITTKKWKYIFTTGKRDLGLNYATGYGPSGITHRLYNLERDPGETHDVSGLQENQHVLNEMKQRMLKLFLETHPGANGVPPNFSIDGKLVWFCEPPDVGAEYGGKPLRVFKNE